MKEVTKKRILKQKIILINRDTQYNRTHTHTHTLRQTNKGKSNEVYGDIM